jgi:5'-deoxynucleotidase YfbR-like HD superfamily hydrolase
MNIFTGNEAVLLDPITRKIPIIIENFNIVSRLDPAKRWDWSEDMLHRVYRDGWFVNSPVRLNDAETIRDHKAHLYDLVDRYYPEHLRATLKAFADVHDNQESIAHALIGEIRRDLNPRFNKNSYLLSEEEKEAVEDIAIKMLLEAFPDKLGAWSEYKAKLSQISVEFSGLDKLCVMWKCVSYVEDGGYQFSDFQRFWDYWTINKAKGELSPIIADAYENDLMPKIELLRYG